MTKKEFIEKYHDSVIKIPMVSLSQENYKKAETVIMICKQAGLSADDLLNKMSPHAEIYIYQNIPSPNPETTKVEFDEFEKDWYSVLEAEKAVNYAIAILQRMEVEFEGVPKQTDMLPNVAQETGFIQGYSSNKCSLWWHPDGRRVFFLIGRGCFELSKYSYE